MSDAKFTKGPWWINKDRDDWYVSPIGACIPIHGIVSPDPSRANAYLICSAPELYGVCEMLDREMSKSLCPPSLELLDALRDALAKARLA